MPSPTEALAVRDLLHDILGDGPVGLWLHGSAVTGTLRPTSDVDLLALVERPLGDTARVALVDGLLRVSGPYPPRDGRRPVELSVVSLPDVLPWRYPPVCDLAYGEWLRAQIVGGRLPARHQAPDLAVQITVARRSGSALHGPSAEQVLDPVPPGDLRRAMLTGVPGLLDDLRGDERNVLLTLARIVVTLETGEIVPKDVAAGLVAPRLGGHSALLELAGEAYAGSAVDDWTTRRESARAAAGALVALIGAAEPPG
ncbi:DUF4111 domain-containing protein [Actinotalea sp. M2MS4P-6]|uniref:aminoglycoside adenylyltransferase domain-containing protein n=1 Tax=Actinotalea sp. M2MS4P-6 TaxID=2983762 RepID=UPI0021E37D93|nr:aminoglycoside adenylyltransferase domain-containing protein [Actinotalea sp. M2MS4P-6]MCV2393584.1 DUF4111 domain-containing protein [Actinotalea sp. M2MS4P-6]